jgi:hypothetical protein
MTTDLLIGEPQIASLKKIYQPLLDEWTAANRRRYEKGDFTRRDRLANE